MLLTFFLFCGFVVEPAIHSHNLRAKKDGRKLYILIIRYLRFCVLKVDGVENEESMWKHSPKSWGM